MNHFRSKKDEIFFIIRLQYNILCHPCLARVLACPKFSSRPARFRVQLHVQDSGGREIWKEEPGDRRMERDDGGTAGSGKENMHANTGRLTLI